MAEYQKLKEEMRIFSEILPDVVSHLKHTDKTEQIFMPRTHRLLENNNGSLLVWSESSKYLYSTPSSTSSLQNASYQTLITSISPIFDIITLKCSTSGQYALLFGPNGIGVVELPRKWGNGGQFEGGKSTCHCRFTVLDESFFTHHITTKIIEVSWYPGSPNDSHIVALTSDNCLRFYDITMPEQPMMRLPLFNESSMAAPCGSISSFASVTGELAVDFDIALPSVDESGVPTYPIYIMQESGDVWALYCKFSQNRLVVEMQGPLTMNPPAEDNYGCSYCNLLCLPSSPTTIAMTTQEGTIHHCLVLSAQEDESFGDFNPSDDKTHNEALYVYESIQLDLNWVNSNADEDSHEDLSKLNNLHLIKSGKDGYISVSEGGIHMVTLPWLQDLNRFLLTELGSSVPDSPTPQVNEPADISYILCTHPSEDSPAVLVCGCTLIENNFSGDCIVLALLATGELIHLRKNSCSKSIWSEFDSSVVKDEKYTSPLRKLRGCGGFDSYIGKILAKNCTVPVIRTGGADKMIPADVYYKLLTKTTQVLHEEYLQKMIQAKMELQKRCKILKSKKDEQRREVLLLQNNSTIIERGDELAGKFETAQENMQSLYERIEAVLRSMQKSAPILSREEEEWGKELNVIQNRLVNLRRLSEVVKKKHENTILQSIPERPANSSLSRNITLTATQAVKFRAHLKDQETSINGLVENVESLKLQLGSR